MRSVAGDAEPRVVDPAETVGVQRNGFRHDAFNLVGHHADLAAGAVSAELGLIVEQVQPELAVRHMRRGTIARGACAW